MLVKVKRDGRWVWEEGGGVVIVAQARGARTMAVLIIRLD